MVQIIPPMKYDRCISCGQNKPYLLRSFDCSLAKKGSITQNITFCTDCLGEMVKQGLLYQPGDEE